MELATPGKVLIIADDDDTPITSKIHYQYQCHFCTESYTRKTNLRHHLVNAHALEYDREQLQREELLEDGLTTEDEGVRDSNADLTINLSACKDCPDSFANVQELERHASIEHYRYCLLYTSDAADE